MKKVSIIVVAYNAHDTLARCLTSLVHQTFDDIEIILVNDASGDDTWEIMQRCREQFPDKVVAINSEQNLGSGGARNLGLEVASGEYIGFCDSDDYCVSNMFELLYQKAKEKDADMVDCGFYVEASDAITISTPNEAEGILDDEKRRILIIQGGYLWSKLFKRELFYDPPVKMREHVRTLSDNDILKYMYLRAKDIWTVKEVLYYYSDAPGSNTKVVDLDKFYESIYGVMEATYRLCHELPTYEGAKLTIEYAQTVWYSYGINRCLYDRIRKYGPDEKHIGDYFDGINDKERQMISDLAQLKEKVITVPYRENSEVMKRMNELDIKIMVECDRRYGNVN